MISVPNIQEQPDVTWGVCFVVEAWIGEGHSGRYGGLGKTTVLVWWQVFMLDVAVFCENRVNFRVLKDIVEARFLPCTLLCVACDGPREWSVLPGWFSGS